MIRSFQAKLAGVAHKTQLSNSTGQDRRLSRRQVLATFGLTPLFIAGCQALPVALGGPTPTPTAPRLLRVGLSSTWTFFDAMLHNVGNHLAPERHVRLETVPIEVPAVDDPQFAADYASAVKALQPGAVPDLLVTDWDVLAPLARASLLKDLGPLLRDQEWFKPTDFYGNGVQAGQIRGKQVALPVSANVESLFYNRAAFQSGGVTLPQNGWSWDQLATAAKSLTTATPGGTAGRWGFSVVPGLPTLWTMAWQRGAQVVSDDGTRIDLSEPGTVAAMGFLADLILNAKVSPRRDAATLRNVNQATNDEFRDMNVGAIAMACGFSGGAIWWRGGGQGDVVLGELPAVAQKVWLGYASMLSIPANAPDPEHSLNGLRALLDASAIGIHLPARKGASNLRQVQELLTESEASALQDALGGIRYLPSEFPTNAILPLLWSSYFTPILTGQKDPAQAGKDAQPMIQEQLSRLMA
jgi:ABC-type glycerol-3-phosphate transport system substrate-binding protein